MMRRTSWITDINVVRIIRHQEQRERRKEPVMYFTQEWLTSEGFMPWDGSAPAGEPIMFMRASWDRPVIASRSEMPIGMQINGLFWKLTGIAKEFSDDRA